MSPRAQDRLALIAGSLLLGGSAFVLLRLWGVL